MSFIKSIGWAVIIIAVICILGKACAALREVLIANFFGVGRITDSYVVAMSLPYRLGLMIGTMAYTAFVPIFNKYLVIDRKDAYGFFNACFVITISILALIGVLLFFNSGFCVRLLAPGLDPASKDISAKLMQIMTAALVLLGVSSLVRAVNSINQHYVASAAHETSANLVNVVAIVILVPFFGVYALAIGVVLGTMGQLLVQGAMFLKNIRLEVSRINFLHPGIKEFFLSLIPLFITVTVIKLNLIIMRWMASMLPMGSISSLNFALTVTLLPVGILDLLILIMIFPFIANLINQKRLPETGRIAGDIVKAIIFALLPLSVFMTILAGPIIELLFQRGAFGANATHMTSVALAFFSASLLATGIDYLFFKLYYLLKETGLYIKLLLVRVGINIILNIVLIKFLMHAGIALAFSLALIIHVGLSAFLLRKKLTKFNLSGIYLFSSKIMLICAVMGLSIYFANHIVVKHFAWDDNFITRLFFMGILGMIAAITYLSCAKLAISKELTLFGNIFRRKTVRLSSFITGE